MNITNYDVYDIAASIVASGFAMQESFNETDFDVDLNLLDAADNECKHIKRIKKLASNPPGSGHCNALSGILVAANVTATNAWWLQMERYHFVQIVTMQSKMHRLKQMITDGTACFNKNVDKATIDHLKDLLCSGATEEQLVYNCPLGLELTARITTNYLALKTIYNQRKNHKLEEWHIFCDWIKQLPMAKELITNEDQNG